MSTLCQYYLLVSATMLKKTLLEWLYNGAITNSSSSLEMMESCIQIIVVNLCLGGYECIIRHNLLRKYLDN